MNGGGGGPGAPLTPAAEPSKNGTPSNPAYGSSWTPHGSPLLDRLTASFKRRGGDGEVALLMIEDEPTPASRRSRGASALSSA